ncbi:MAG: exo-alpha-sialidase, partial [Methanobacteriota archaeon]
MADAKKGETVVTVGTRKGLFVFHSKDRRRWKKRGPYFEGVEIRHAILDPMEGKALYAGVTSEHWGPMVSRSTNLGDRWDLGKEGPRFTKESGLTVTRIWQLQQGVDGSLYAGTEPAGLFRSEDHGVTWSSVDALNYREGRDKWPPGGGGLCLHTILPYPKDVKRMLVGISAAGIFTTNNGGSSWRMYDAGIREYGKQKFFDKEDTSTCVHKMVRDPADPA